jgi:16S rRNA (cytidine1402-2'-O)-methyltransferase
MSKLIIVGTPLGNLEDMTFRAVKILKEADVIFTEDKRVSIKLLNHFEIGTKELFTFNEATAERKVSSAFEIIKKNNICCLISDSGMPVISDPGYQLIQKCVENGIEIDVIPGPSAPITALAASGFPASKFIFLGFLPRDKNRRRLLRNLTENDYVIVFFESPNRIVKCLIDIQNILGDREVCIAREMTKIYQEFLRGKISEVLIKLNEKDEIRGELTIVISGK